MTVVTTSADGMQCAIAQRKFSLVLFFFLGSCLQMIQWNVDNRLIYPPHSHAHTSNEYDQTRAQFISFQTDMYWYNAFKNDQDESGKRSIL